MNKNSHKTYAFWKTKNIFCFLSRVPARNSGTRRKNASNYKGFCHLFIAEATENVIYSRSRQKAEKERKNVMTSKQVLLSVTGTAQNPQEDEDAVRLLTTGTLTGDNDAWRLNYTETQPDGSGTHEITVTLDKGVVIMQRQGEYATSMVFEKGCRFEGSYATPFGELAMGVYATQVKYQVDPQTGGEVNLQYQLDLQGQFAAMHELRIRFCPAGKA